MNGDGGGQYFACILDTPGLNESGFMYTTCYAGGEAMCYSDPPYGGVGAFQQNFLVQSFAYVSDLEPLADMSDIDAVKNHLYKIPVGLTGGAGTDSYCYTKAGAYSLQISPERDAKNSPELWFDSWGDIYEASYGAPNTDCGTTLEKTNTSVSEAYKGHWGNFLPTIAYAVEDGAPGAAAGWARLTNADNWSSLENSGFEDVPIWGIVPRGWE